MSSTLDFIGATLADALSPRFRRPVEDIIYETIDRKQIPTRTDFSELRNTLNALRSQTTGSQQGIEKLKVGLDELEESIHDLTTRISDLEQVISNQETRTAATVQEDNGAITLSSGEYLSLLQRIEALESLDIKKPTSQPSVISEDCKVDECGTKARGQGFCQKHYGRWRRGTLKGYVSYEATITVDGESVTVADEYKGLPYSIEGEGKQILIDGKAI